jgi:hypothetical protein
MPSEAFTFPANHNGAIELVGGHNGQDGDFNKKVSTAVSFSR